MSLFGYLVYVKSFPSLPLHLDTYPAPLAQDVARAIDQVTAMAPLPAGRLGHGLTGRHPLPSPLPHLIAIYGKKRTGKTSSADFIEQRYGGVTQFAFSALIAKEINDYLATWPPYRPPSDLHGRTVTRPRHVLDDENKVDPRYRYLLQMWGQARRFEDPRYWLDQLEDLYLQTVGSDSAQLVLMPGLREPAEKDEVERLGGEVWKLVRPGLPDDQDVTSRHPNETALDDMPDSAFARVIVNDAPDLIGWCRTIEEALHEYD